MPSNNLTICFYCKCVSLSLLRWLSLPTGLLIFYQNKNVTFSLFFLLSYWLDLWSQLVILRLLVEQGNKKWNWTKIGNGGDRERPERRRRRYSQPAVFCLEVAIALHNCNLAWWKIKERRKKETGEQKKKKKSKQEKKYAKVNEANNKKKLTSSYDCTYLKGQMWPGVTRCDQIA